MEFAIGSKSFDGARTLLMGILNVTPDSFADGGRYFDRERAIERGFELADDGADIIDIGGESTRPGSEPVDEREEIARVIPVVEALAGGTGVPLSVDTMKAGVAEAALDAGASMVNDVSALRFDPRMTEVVAARGCPVALMHMRGEPRTMQANPRYERVVEEIYTFLVERIEFAGRNGIPRSRIIVDPGIGFGKTLEHNLDILRNIRRFRETGCPVLVGASRKRMIEAISGAPVGDRDWGTAAIASWCVGEGVDILRVHNARAMRQVCAVAAALRG